jgi:curved DNA-binding protein CbpA
VSGMREHDDPFGALGLPARAGLTDEDVRAAWKRIAAAAHPDRDDGGDPDRFGAAAAAYETLRTSFGRGEALADLAAAAPRRSRHRARHGGGARRRRSGLAGARLVAGGRVSRYFGSAGRATAGRSTALALLAAATAVTAVAVIGWTPATIGLAAGTATWLLASHTRRP